MLRVFGDFESYYDSEYSLRKMSPVEYILDHRWETLGCAVAIEHEEPFFLPLGEVADYLRSIKEPYAFISHNALFDACILAYRYNIHPDALICTLSMARALLRYQIPNGRVSLAAVSKHLGIDEKQEGVLGQMRGKHFADLERDAGLMMGLVGYALVDVNNCREIFFKLRSELPPAEGWVMDRVIKMATRPKLALDLNALAAYHRELLADRQKLMDDAGITERVTLMSNPQFAELLTSYGVDPPIKISPTTGQKTYAFARSDHDFMELLEHPDPAVQAIMAARVGVKSTIEETRTRRFISIGMATQSNDIRSKTPDDQIAIFNLGTAYLPVPLKYGGAHTHRFSGDWQLNMQNLGARKTRRLRTCIIAPEGYLIVATDASQIEARLTAWLAGQLDLLNQFASGEDVYKWFASQLFNVSLLGVTKVQRFVAKTCILGLGFGMSDGKLYHTIVTMAREQNIDVAIKMIWCIDWVRFYRDRFGDIQRYWRTLGDVIALMANRDADGMQLGPCWIEGTTVILPTQGGTSGLKLQYHELRLYDNEYWYRYGQFNKKLYGGKLLENVVQALDRQHVVEANMRIERRAAALGIDARIALNEHDANVYCVPEEQAVTLASICYEEMSRNVSWSAGLPLSAEVKIGKNLGDMEEWKFLRDAWEKSQLGEA